MFRLDITPRRCNVAVWPHAVTPNSVTCPFPAAEETLEKFKAGTPSSVRCAPLPAATCLLLRLLGHINLAAPRSEAGEPITVQKQSQAEREGTKDQRNRAAIVQE